MSDVASSTALATVSKNGAPAIIADNLVKTFGDFTAVNRVSFKVPKGSIFALLGPNGAGKTTTVNILCTLLKPSGGRAEVAGYDVVKQAAEARRSMMLTGQFAALDESLSGRENLILFGRLLGLSKGEAVSRADELTQVFGLSDAINRRVSQYSGGMRRRIDIACGLVVRPEVVFLDEPTTGLDPRSRQEVWTLVDRLRDQGITTLLTTQYLEEADALSDNIVVIDKGTVIAQGTASELKSQTGATRCEIVPINPNDIPRIITALHDMIPADQPTNTDISKISIPAPRETDTLMEVVERLSAENIALSDIGLRRPSLDEVFLQLTNKDANKPKALGSAEVKPVRPAPLLSETATKSSAKQPIQALPVQSTVTEKLAAQAAQEIIADTRTIETRPVGKRPTGKRPTGKRSPRNLESTNITTEITPTIENDNSTKNYRADILAKAVATEDAPAEKPWKPVRPTAPPTPTPVPAPRGRKTIPVAQRNSIETPTAPTSLPQPSTPQHNTEQSTVPQPAAAQQIPNQQTASQQTAGQQLAQPVFMPQFMPGYPAMPYGQPGYPAGFIPGYPAPTYPNQAYPNPAYPNPGYQPTPGYQPQPEHSGPPVFHQEETNSNTLVPVNVPGLAVTPSAYTEPEVPPMMAMMPMVVQVPIAFYPQPGSYPPPGTYPSPPTNVHPSHNLTVNAETVSTKDEIIGEIIDITDGVIIEETIDGTTNDE